MGAIFKGLKLSFYHVIDCNSMSCNRYICSANYFSISKNWKTLCNKQSTDIVVYNWNSRQSEYNISLPSFEVEVQTNLLNIFERGLVLTNVILRISKPVSFRDDLI